MSDQEVTVLELPRGRRGKITLSRVMQGSDRFTKLVMLYPQGDGADAPLKAGGTLSFRGPDEHERLASVFGAIAKKERDLEASRESFSATTPTPARGPQHRTISATEPLSAAKQLAEDKLLF